MSVRIASVAMVGMPFTGKSTFLAALYQQLTDPPPGVDARLGAQPTQRVYLEELRRAWLEGRPLDRTTPDSGELVELEVLVGLQRVDLTVPDIAGEAFRQVFTARQVDARVVELVRDASGLLLFTHPNHVRTRVLIAQARRMAELLDEPPPLEQPRKDFDPRLVPGEVQLVDLLQWAASVRAERDYVEPCRVAVIVSAWDRIARAMPAGWVAAKMPMLHQFLEGQGDHLTARVYGVSAQGGDYDEESLADRPPADRAYFVGPNGDRGNDLSNPLRWTALG